MLKTDPETDPKTDARARGSRVAATRPKLKDHQVRPQEIPCLSLFHLTRENVDWLNQYCLERVGHYPIALAYTGGFVLQIGHLDDEDILANNMPSEMANVLIWAFLNRYEWLRLDEYVGVVVENLPLFIWE